MLVPMLSTVGGQAGRQAWAEPGLLGGNKTTKRNHDAVNAGGSGRAMHTCERMQGLHTARCCKTTNARNHAHLWR
jgi:hypothetical protein